MAPRKAKVKQAAAGKKRKQRDDFFEEEDGGDEFFVQSGDEAGGSESDEEAAEEQETAEEKRLRLGGGSGRATGPGRSAWQCLSPHAAGDGGGGGGSLRLLPALGPLDMPSCCMHWPWLEAMLSQPRANEHHLQLQVMYAHAALRGPPNPSLLTFCMQPRRTWTKSRRLSGQSVSQRQTRMRRMQRQQRGVAVQQQQTMEQLPTACG